MVNPVEFVGGAALGTAVSLLCAGLEDMIVKSHVFASHFKDIRSRLQLLQLVFKEMSANQQLSNADVDVLNRFEKVLKDGKTLVDKCKEISRWDRIKRYRYENKLIGWEEKLEKQLSVVNLLGVLNTMTTRESVGNLTEKMKNVRVDSNQTMRQNTGMQDQSEIFRAWTLLPEHLVGLDGPLNKLKEKLLKDDGLSKLVLTGPAGCGKTTLVSKFCLDEQVKDKFKDNIIFVTISKDPKMNHIVQQLCDQKGKTVPPYTNEEYAIAARWLQIFMRNEGKSPLLLVLDDVWPGSESLLQKFDLGMTDYKVLVTSRSQLEGFGSTHDVKLLDEKSAMELFHHSASLGNKSSHISKDVAKQIVTHCQGFPVALRVVGESLSGKPEAVWKARLTEWSRGSSSIVSEKELLCCLKSSIDQLKKDMPIAEQCFLDFGLFPLNKYIPVATLFDMWRELYDLRDDNVWIAKLIELSSRSLANLVDGREVKMETDGYYSQHFVIQYGLIRELAIFISKQVKEEDKKRLIIEIFGESRPEWWCEQPEQECQNMQALLLSISTDAKFSKKWPNIRLPKAKVLVLFFQTKDYVLPEFVDKMPKLKVLVITCDGSYVLGAALTGFQPLNQLSNLKTIILEGISIPSITRNPILLKSVKKISLSRCYEVSEAFRDSVKISDFFPELEVMNVDFCNLVELPPDLGDLTLLRELNITNCCGLSTLPEGMEKLVNLEVLRLRFCRDFSKFPRSIKLQRLKSLDLAYCSSIMELPKNIGELSNLKQLDTRNCSVLKELPPSISDLTHLKVVICSSKTKMLTEALPHGKNIDMEAPTLGWDDFNE